jgi:holin-like protein
MATRIKKLMLITIQIAALLLISEAGSGFVRMLHLPLSGNLVGMLLLLVLLTSGVIRLEWVEAGASLLVRHLAIFFIPIAVGLMVFGDVFVRSGIAIVATLIVSAAIGLWVAGWTSQVLTPHKGGDLR